MYISFGAPWYLVFVFAIPVLIVLHFVSLKSKRRTSLKFANFEAIARIKGIDLYSKSIGLLVFNVLFVFLLVMALSGLTFHNEVDASGFSFVIVMDTSESMSAKDMSPDRISVAKKTAIDFVESLPSESYVGIVSFSGDSLIEHELSKSKQSLKSAINNIDLSVVGGTNIYRAVLNAGKLLEGEKNKAIILLSDGQINVGKIQEVIDFVEENDILVHTFGIGSVEGGEVSYGLSKLDEDSLKSLAFNSNGKYFNVQDSKDMESSFKEMVNVTQKIGSFELASYLLLIVVILFVIREFWVGVGRVGW